MVSESVPERFETFHTLRLLSARANIAECSREVLYSCVRCACTWLGLEMDILSQVNLFEILLINYRLAVLLNLF
jgi:hypothetical protein